MVYLLRRGPGLRADDGAGAGLDALPAQRGRGRPHPLVVGGLRRLRVRRGLHALHERLRARGPVRVGPVGASRRRAGRRSSATAVAAVGFAPWLSGLRGDLDSPTTDILSALPPFSVGYVRSSLVHWAIGFPYLLRGHVRARAARGAGARRARARARPGARRDSTAAALRGRLRSPRPPAGARDRARRLGAGRRGARQRGRLEPLRDAQPGRVVARLRALPRRAARRRRPAARPRRGRAGDRRVRGRRPQDARPRLRAARRTRRRSRSSTATRTPGDVVVDGGEPEPGRRAAR